MDRIKPLGSSLPSSDAASSAVSATVSTKVSALQWVSLARATWMWIIRPLWYLLVVFPCRLMGYMLGSHPMGAISDRQYQDYDSRKRNPTNPFGKRR